MKTVEIIQKNKFSQCWKFYINQSNLLLIIFNKKISSSNKKINTSIYKKV